MTPQYLRELLPLGLSSSAQEVERRQGDGAAPRLSTCDVETLNLCHSATDKRFMRTVSVVFRYVWIHYFFSVRWFPFLSWWSGHWTGWWRWKLSVSRWGWKPITLPFYPAVIKHGNGKWPYRIRRMVNHHNHHNHLRNGCFPWQTVQLPEVTRG